MQWRDDEGCIGKLENEVVESVVESVVERWRAAERWRA